MNPSKLKFLLSLTLSSCLIACDGGGSGSSADDQSGESSQQADKNPTPYEPIVNAAVVLPSGGDCTGAIEVSAAILSNGFGFDLSNTRNQNSPINSSNVASLVRDFEYAKAGAAEKRGAPAVTVQAIFFSANNANLKK